MKGEEMICLECNKPWELPDREKNWYLRHGLVPPRRCAPCRKKLKDARDNRAIQEGGLETKEV